MGSHLWKILILRGFPNQYCSRLKWPTYYVKHIRRLLKELFCSKSLDLFAYKETILTKTMG